MATAFELLATLDIRTLRERLEEIERERKALMTLLRAARQLERQASKAEASTKQEPQR